MSENSRMQSQKAIRAVTVFAMLGIPGSLFTAASTVPVGLCTIYIIYIIIKGGVVYKDIRLFFYTLLALYCSLVVTDYLNGGGIENLEYTALNYLPLLTIGAIATLFRYAQLDDNLVVKALVATVLISLAMSVVQYVAFGISRPGGLLINPIPYGFVLALWGVMLMSFAIKLHSQRLVFTALLATIPLILTGSKLVWLAAVGGYGVLIVRWTVTHRRLTPLICSIVFLAIVGVGAYYSPVGMRIDEFRSEMANFLTSGDRSGSSFGHRYVLLEAGWNAFRNGPVFGYGLAEARSAVDKYIGPEAPDVSHLVHLHNDYVVHLVSFGYVGVIFLIAFFIFLCCVARNAEPDRRNAAYALILMSAIYMCGDIYFNIEPISGPLAIYIGLIMSSVRGRHLS